MSLLEPLRKIGYNLPEKEKPETITVEEILAEIRAFYARLSEAKTQTADYAEGYHLNLIADYPYSMCQRNITDTLGLVMALVYCDGFPTEEQLKKYQKDVSDGYDPLKPEQNFSMDDLSLVFNKSKSTIYQAINKHEAQARDIIRATQLKQVVHDKAMAELVEAEKLRIKNEGTNQQTSEQTSIT